MIDHRAVLLATYDEQLRGVAEMQGAQSWDPDGPLYRALWEHGGFVSYESLAGVEDLDDLIEGTVAYFAGCGQVNEFEWKTRGHDHPADLDARLQSADLVPEAVREVFLVSVDDQVCGPGLGLGEECLTDGQRRAAIGQANLDDHPGPLSNKQIPEHIGIAFRERYPGKVAGLPLAARTDLAQPPAGATHGAERVARFAHSLSIAASTGPPMRAHRNAHDLSSDGGRSGRSCRSATGAVSERASLR